MGVKKTNELNVSVPSSACYEMMRAIGSELKWKVLEENPNKCILRWQQGDGIWSPVVRISVSLTPRSAQDTLVEVTGEIPVGLMDGRGLIPKTWDKLLVPFERLAAEATIVNTQIQEGLLCPKCGKQLPPGTRFCPHDGTAIASQCPECGHSNIPSAKFCASCGAKLGQS